MAYDALTLSVLCEEFQSLLVGGKITKIYQPERDEIILFLFNKQTHKLVISSNASVNRIHITEMPTENPKTAPSFCMLLRKHITNAVIDSISQMPYERVLDFLLTVSDDLGYRKKMHLLFELTGKTSNIFLTEENYIILDSIKHLPQDIQATRLMLPGTKYTFFAPQEKLPPFDLLRISRFLATCATPLRKTLTEVLLGVSQSTVNEMLHGIDENDHSPDNNIKVVRQIEEYQKKLQHKAPNVVLQKGVPVEVCPFDYLSKRGEKLFFDTLNKAHDQYFYLADKAQRFNDKAKSVAAIVKNAISRTEKKLAAQKQSVLEAENREQFRQYGDLIVSNLWQIADGADNFSCFNYYTNTEVSIPLDRQLSPNRNAQAYYKKYRKLKSAAQHNQKLVEENEKVLQHLLTIKQNLRFCSEPEDLQQIREELASMGLIKETTAKKQKETPMRPLHFVVDGFDVYAGKNNLQNNHVTFHIGKPTDLWLHAQKIHSSHVVIVSGDATPPPHVIVAAAEICAFYSQAAAGSKIPVDFTLRKNVRRPTGAAAGFVVYTDHKTVVVDPNCHQELAV